MTAGLGKVQQRLLSGMKQGLVVLDQAEGSRKSLCRAARSLEKRGLVHIWRIWIPDPARAGKIPRITRFRRITVVAEPRYNEKLVILLVVERLRLD